MIPNYVAVVKRKIIKENKTYDKRAKFHGALVLNVKDKGRAKNVRFSREPRLIKFFSTLTHARASVKSTYLPANSYKQNWISCHPHRSRKLTFTLAAHLIVAWWRNARRYRTLGPIKEKDRNINIIILHVIVNHNTIIKNIIYENCVMQY